jgi:hypothetical protein
MICSRDLWFSRCSFFPCWPKAQSRELKMTTCSVGLLREGWKPCGNCGYTGAFAATGLITAKDSFTAISTNSGGSGNIHKKSPSSGRTYRESLIILSCWHDTGAALFFSFWLCGFSTQFFYSQKIFDILIEGGKDPSRDSMSAIGWMPTCQFRIDHITAVCDGFNLFQSFRFWRTGSVVRVFAPYD